ncbi:hypothetical protein GCM10008027_30690 [Pseudoalteromonas gelatinilytica]|uniref:Uncharacterized protein n=1 Tax=Pseudoalteromonas gelatinilytica TaxID=1703256 RepID=A0ABQ1TWU6_9GAMM|nr:hypothetical protein GCM10008027_30690 [Pseudoalteromonas profundi]
MTNPMATFLDQTQLTIQGNWFGFANVNSKALNIDIFIRQLSVLGVFSTIRTDNQVGHQPVY